MPPLLVQGLVDWRRHQRCRERRLPVAVSTPRTCSRRLVPLALSALFGCFPVLPQAPVVRHGASGGLVASVQPALQRRSWLPESTATQRRLHGEATLYFTRGWRGAAERPSVRVTSFLTTSLVAGADVYAQLPTAWTGKVDAGIGLRMHGAEGLEWGGYGSLGGEVGSAYVWASAGRMRLVPRFDAPPGWVTTALVGVQTHRSVGWVIGALSGPQDTRCQPEGRVASPSRSASCPLVIRGFAGLVIDRLSR